MARLFGVGVRKQSTIPVWAALASFVLVTAPAGPVFAQADSKNSAEVAAQGDEFSRQKGEILTRLKALKGKIDSAGGILNKNANAAEVARQAIEDMRAVVSPLLAAVADNGEIAKLGASALKNAIDRKTMLERDMRFSSEDRQKLVEAWDKRVKAATDATADLEKSRTKFLQLMTMLQTKEDLIGEWAAIKAQDEVNATIKQLVQALNESSVDVKNFIAWLEAPGS